MLRNLAKRKLLYRINPRPSQSNLIVSSMNVSSTMNSHLTSTDTHFQPQSPSMQSATTRQKTLEAIEEK